MEPFVSVVVPALNAERIVDRCLTALLHQTLPRDRYEILVVDDGSRDRTAQRAAELGARVIRLEQTTGPGGARNAGVSAARGEIIVFTDVDCEPTAGFLEALVSPLRNPDVGGAKGVYLSRQRELVARFVQIEYEDRYRHTATTQWIDFVDTYAACFWRKDIERVGGFDPTFRVCEDQELAFRLAEAGVRIRFVPEACTYHLHARSMWGYVRKKFGIAWWKVAVLRRHPGKVLRDSHTPQMMKLEMLVACALAGAMMMAGPLMATERGVWASASVGIALLAYLGLIAPFWTRALWKDRTVGFAAPGLLFLRDLALVAGIAAGLKNAPRPSAESPRSWLAPRNHQRPASDTSISVRPADDSPDQAPRHADVNRASSPESSPLLRPAP